MKFEQLCLVSLTLFIHVASTTTPPFSCDSLDPTTKNYPFCQTTLPVTQRARDLVSRLTLDEKISQLVNSAPAIPRLGIPAYEWWSEALHGVSNVGPGIKFDGTIKAATSFPQVILATASFDAYQWYRIGQVTVQDLADTYQPPFEKCVREGGGSCMMCAYNRVNGVPSCADPNLLSKTVRGEWDFKGYIASDCDAVAIIYDAQGYAKSPEDAVADVLRAGMDVNCGSYLQKYTKSAILQKKLPESQVDRALHNLFAIRMRLGLFNGNPLHNPFGNIRADQICSPEHQILALEAARNGIVLLKNHAKLLPLPKSAVSLAVIGPNAKSPQTLVGNYAGPPCESTTPLQALQSYVKDTVYHPGCDTVSCSSVAIDEAVDIAKRAHFVVLIMGLDQTQEREALDRVDLLLPGRQQELITSVAKSAKKPVVLVLLSGGPVDVSFAKDDPRIGAILWAGYPGQGGGIALAEIIVGDHNPGGRLPVTWYPQDYTKVPMTDMRMRPDSFSDYPGRTYRFYEGDKVFEFGYGLSYSKYSYKFTHVSRKNLYLNHSSSLHTTRSWDSIGHKLVSELGTQVCDENKFKVGVGVKNDGEMSGKHPVLLFARQGKVGDGRVKKQLIGFQSVVLSGGERGEIEFEVSPCEDLSRANEYGVMIMDEGRHFLVVGDDKLPMKLKYPFVLIHISTVVLILAESSRPPFACDSSHPLTKSYTFCKPTLPINQRVQDLISRLTLDEKISQLVNSAPPIPRLGIPEYEWWSEALHGVAYFPGLHTGMSLNGTIQSATSFPQVILTAASFDVSLQDLADTYMPPFRSCIEEGKASGIMCAYNRVNGVPNCADYNLLSKTARAQWGFNGYITSDCDAVSIIHEEQGYAKLPEDAVADVLKAGMDVNCGNYLKNYTKSAVVKRKLPISEIDRALHNLFSVRMRLGLFDGNPLQQPFGKIGPDQVCSQEHQNLALEAARNSIVLLKNTYRLLPFSKAKTTSLAVIGPNANSAKTLLGNYAGPPCKTVTPLQGLQRYVKDIRYHPGCNAVNCSYTLTDQAVKVAEGAEYVVLVMGLDQTQEREELDRVDLVLSPKQQNLISILARAAKNPVVLVLLSGGPVDIRFAKYDKHIGSILWAGYPGEAGGLALAEIIFGDHNPGGRLPVTWYPQSFVKVPMTDMRMRPEPSSGYPGRTYSKRIPVTVRAQNHGDMAGRHPLLLFVRSAKAGNGRPEKQLVGFQSVILNAGERADVEFELSPCEHLSTANEDGLMVIEEGSHFLSIEGKESEITVIL
ncbi:putative beta-D-xylosidase 7 [Gossypium australe]|uniref:Putative beta-D-xylosidase 7 n=1 Tax=Gossypium australe TaxID=47621 RepID=A0A5B6V860_9ROSI|nr:putative beta-D-xylosidase 7 [Gossypium australe]